MSERTSSGLQGPGDRQVLRHEAPALSALALASRSLARMGNLDMKLPDGRVLSLALLLSFACSLPASAQILSSPLGGAPSTAPAGAPQGGLPGGQGAGVHSPLSPFAPLPRRNDVVPWSLLTDVSTRVENLRIIPTYSAAVRELDKKQVRIQGYMMPLEPGEMQRHFLLTSVPLTCSFCVPGGPESMIEVRTREPVRYSMAAVVVEGRLQVLQSDPMGLYYRITGAAPVK